MPQRSAGLRPLVTATLIVRDEEAHLPGCLDCLTGWIDEIVVVDTGSRDATPRIAADAGAVVIHVPWTDDFSAARNAALDAATGDWILYIDADERIRPPVDTEAVREDLRTGLGARTVRLHPKQGWTGYREYRLWRNHPNVRFAGRIHETVVPSLADVLARDLDTIPASGLVIDHLGYEGDLTHKFRRNLPLLRREVERNPGRAYLWHDLGTALRGLGYPAAAGAAWTCGLEAVRSQPGRPEGILLYLDLLTSGYEDGQPIDHLLVEAEALYPGSHGLVWLRGRRLVDEQRYREAAQLFEALSATDPTDLDGGVVSYARSLFETAAPEALALCLFRLGRYDKSADIYEHLARSGSPAGGHRVKGALAHARGGRADGPTRGCVA